MTEIIEKELCYVVNGCIFDVHNELGPGLREECYQKAMEVRLAQAGIPFNSKPYTRRELTYFGQIADVFAPDLLIAERLIVELKAMPEGLCTASFRQTINYLKLWNYELGLLVNFAEVSATIQRVVFHDTMVQPVEDYEAIRGTMRPEVRAMLVDVREAILGVHRDFGLGYSDATYRKLIEIALMHRGLDCQSSVTAEPSFRERQLPHSPITPLMVEGSILIQVDAIYDGVTARSMRTMQTHLGVMNAAIGLVASFGQNVFEIRGVRQKNIRAN